MKVKESALRLLKYIKSPLKYVKSPKWDYAIDKKIRFVVTTLVLTVLMLISTFFFFESAVIFIPLFIIFTYILVYFSILEDIDGVEWYTLFIMPVLLTVSFYLFYSILIPGRWITRIPFLLIYALCINLNLRSSNVFNVGVEKSLQLYRAAFSSNYFFQTLVSFLFFNVLSSLRADFPINAVGAALIAFPLSLQLFWTIRLNRTLDREFVVYALFLSMIVGEAALVLSFVPFPQTLFALILTTIYYSLTGLMNAYLDQRLFKETVREYVFVLSAVFIISILAIKW